MDATPTSSRSSRRLLVWGIILIALVLALGGFVLALPRIAPQFVIAHSPWIWPVLRAEAYETEGKKTDLTVTAPLVVLARNSLTDRILDEDGWKQASIPVLVRSLDHPDLRMRRTAIAALHFLLTSSNAMFPESDLASHLQRLLDDPDPDVFSSAFRLLIYYEDPTSALAVLGHLPRVCSVQIQGHNSLDARLSEFFGSEGMPHPLRHLRLADLVGQAQRWLATNDPDLMRLALMTLGFSQDPQALPLLDAHLGKHVEKDPYWVGWDPVSYALSLSSLPGVNDLLASAMEDPEPTRRRSAAHALAGRNDMADADRSLALLRAHIDDEDYEVRRQVAHGLVNFRLEQTLPDVLHIIARGGQIALSAIEYIRFKRMSLHRSRPWWGRGDVVPVVNPDMPENWALEARIFAEFSAFVSHSEPAVRFELARYLCSTWEPDTERVLRSMADDPDPQVRAEIAAELQAITTRTRRDPTTYRSYQPPEPPAATRP